MKFLGVDYGRKRIGLAVAVNSIVEPKSWLENKKGVFEKIAAICREEEVEKVVVGSVKGKIEKEIQKFAKGLSEVLKLKVFMTNEDLTSWEAEKMVGWKNKGRVDSVAAALILERYLEKISSLEKRRPNV